MLRALILGALALLLPGAGGATPAQRSLAYVAAEQDDRLVVVDIERGQVLARVSVPDGPHNVAATGDGRIVAVTSPPAGQLTILDGRRFRVLHVIGGFRSPHDVKLSPDGRTAYVTDEARGTLNVVDTGSGRLLRRLPAGAGAHDLATGDFAWVTHGPRRVPLALFGLYPQPRRPTPKGTLDASGAAHDVVKVPDTADVFVTYWGAGTVARLRLGGAQLLWRRAVGTEIHHLAFDGYSGQRLWVTDRAGRLLLLNARTGSVLERFGGCAGPHHVAVVTGRRAVAACNDTGTVGVFDDRAGLVRSIAVGRGPHGIAAARVP